MKLALMVHQFGTPGEEWGRLRVMNVLFGCYCTQKQNQPFTQACLFFLSNFFKPPPGGMQLLLRPHGVSRAPGEKTLRSHSLTMKRECQCRLVNAVKDQSQACFFCQMEHAQRDTEEAPDPVNVF